MGRWFILKLKKDTQEIPVFWTSNVSRHQSKANDLGHRHLKKGWNLPLEECKSVSRCFFSTLEVNFGILFDDVHLCTSLHFGCMQHVEFLISGDRTTRRRPTGPPPKTSDLSLVTSEKSYSHTWKRCQIGYYWNHAYVTFIMTYAVVSLYTFKCFQFFVASEGNNCASKIEMNPNPTRVKRSF